MMHGERLHPSNLLDTYVGEGRCPSLLEVETRRSHTVLSCTCEDASAVPRHSEIASTSQTTSTSRTRILLAVLRSPVVHHNSASLTTSTCCSMQLYTGRSHRLEQKRPMRLLSEHLVEVVPVPLSLFVLLVKDCFEEPQY